MTIDIGIPSLGDALAGKTSEQLQALGGAARGSRIHRLSNRAPAIAPIEEQLEPVDDQPLEASAMGEVPYGTRMPPVPEDAPPKEEIMPKKNVKKASKAPEVFNARELIQGELAKAAGPLKAMEISKAVGLSSYLVNKELRALELDNAAVSEGKGAHLRWARTAGSQGKATAPKASRQRPQAARDGAANSPQFAIDDRGGITFFLPAGGTLQVNDETAERIFRCRDAIKAAA